MHVEFFVKIPTEIYPCMIHAHKMASRVEGSVAAHNLHAHKHLFESKKSVGVVFLHAACMAT